MSADRRVSTRRWIARAVVAVGHVLVVLLVVTGRPRAPDDGSTRQRTLAPYLLLEWLPQAVAPPPAPATLRRASATRSPAPPPIDPSLGTQLAAPVSPAPRIDWDREAERVGRTGANLVTPDTRRCDDTDRPGSMLPRCTPRIEPFEWNPEPNVINFGGGIPYVRVGKMCVVGLGFFACGLGTPPPANGHLLDEMKSPNRSRESVPGNE
jgi:hypothetical protein